MLEVKVVCLFHAIEMVNSNDNTIKPRLKGLLSNVLKKKEGASFRKYQYFKYILINFVCELSRHKNSE